jgi:hypothetical protein
LPTFDEGFDHFHNIFNYKVLSASFMVSFCLFNLFWDHKTVKLQS